ncbi:MAG: SpoIIE family protein phosphatase [Rhodothermales bacterium]|nr:SpoIIE family protein phosphatase [Rhodothermales bacterium]
MPAPRLHLLTLRFSTPRREAAFRVDYFRQSARLVRWAVLLGCVQYALFGLLDAAMVPESAGTIRVIRAVVCGLLLGFIGFTYTRRFTPRSMQAAIAVVPVIGGAGLAVMAFVGQDPNAYYDYYAGLMLILVYVHVLLRLRFVWATAVSGFVIALYLAVTEALLDTPAYLVFNNGTFLVSTNVTGMVASYALEFYARRVFWQREELAAQHRRLAADAAQKAQELAEARDLQLGLLPQALPEHPAVALAAWSRPATEVGGDYYDVEMAADGALTFAIGDATGHGARAGAMVTAAKVLFAGLTPETDVAEALRRATPVIRRVGHRRVFMALALGRLRGQTLELAGAGMPPALIRRAATGAVEAVPLKGMPLGSFLEYAYQKQTVELFPGDTVALMSDGFAELFRDDGEMLGYEAATDVLAAAGDATPVAVLEGFKAAAESGAGGRPPNDDLTFLILQRKPHPVAPAPTNGRDQKRPAATA